MELYKFINENKVKKYDGGFVVKDNRIYTNPTESTLMSVGYKKLVKGKMPKYDENSQYITSVYTDGTENITENFEVHNYEVISDESDGDLS